MRLERHEGFIHFSVKEKWENLERQWLYAEVSQDSPFLRLPVGPPVHSPGWSERPVLDGRWDPVLGRFVLLLRADLLWVTVAFDFFRQRLAPLQERHSSVWSYTGDDDDMRIARGAGSSLDEARFSHLMRLATDEGNLAAALHLRRVRPLCEDEGRLAVLVRMPHADVRGLIPAVDTVGAAGSDMILPARPGCNVGVGDAVALGVVATPEGSIADHSLGDASDRFHRLFSDTAANVT
ncbi:putative retrotransposon protein [Panicum miliaceum]|uniref:Retrotransposon protein n=1 Tax=Panicum miliaceum TaxID=4540 RepID=A0A3L6TCJ5_PANMI|nr:putative retrotransposon protein [Panicum miliaceum]